MNYRMRRSPFRRNMLGNQKSEHARLSLPSGARIREPRRGAYCGTNKRCRDKKGVSSLTQRLEKGLRKAWLSHCLHPCCEEDHCEEWISVRLSPKSRVLISKKLHTSHFKVPYDRERADFSWVAQGYFATAYYIP